MPNWARIGAARVTGLAWDFTKRKRVEETLRASEDRLRLALSAARVGIWALDVTTGMHRRGGELNRLLGLEAVKSAQPFPEFLNHVHPDNRAAVAAVFGESVRRLVKIIYTRYTTSGYGGQYASSGR